MVCYGNNSNLIQVLNSNIGLSNFAQFPNYLLQKL